MKNKHPFFLTRRGEKIQLKLWPRPADKVTKIICGDMGAGMPYYADKDAVQKETKTPKPNWPGA